jgi:lipooligosaccharide transport system permease protein
MFLFSGTFFPVSQLPEWLQPVARITPVWHGVELSRAIALDRAPEMPAAVHIGYLVLLIVVGWVLSVRALKKRMQP